MRVKGAETLPSSSAAATERLKVPPDVGVPVKVPVVVLKVNQEGNAAPVAVFAEMLRVESGSVKRPEGTVYVKALPRLMVLFVRVPVTVGAALKPKVRSAPVAVKPTAGVPWRCSVVPVYEAVGTRFKLASVRGSVLPLPGKLPPKSA